MEIRRHELKFFISETEYWILSRKLRRVLPSDPYDKAGRGYFIRSLYFDTMENQAFWEKQFGVGERKKYRLRIYNFESKEAKLEIKSKLNNQIFKETATISRKDAEEIQKGNYEVLPSYKNKVLNKIYYTFKRERYRPVVIIDYIREPFVLPFNHIRITFDRFLKSNDYCFDIFKKDLFMKSFLGPGAVVLEVKYDGFIPGWIKKVLQIQNFERSPIGKYFNGRLKPNLIYRGV